MAFQGIVFVVSLIIVYVGCHKLPGNQDLAAGCQERSFGEDSIVCVCNERWCDTLDPVTRQKAGIVTSVVTSRGGRRFAKHYYSFQQSEYNKILTYRSHSRNSDVTVTLEPNKTYQNVLGFGGAITDSAAINLNSLPDSLRHKCMEGYYSVYGLEYSIGRIPIASCDYSPRPYTYDDVPGDFGLKNFSLQPEDLNLKIPLIQLAGSFSRYQIKWFGSAWSAPAWMKTNGNLTGRGFLRGNFHGKYYKTWANYLVRFVQEYKKQGISIWGLTAQNEPTDGRIFNFPFQAMGWTAEMQRDFLAHNLGPALERAYLNNTKIMILDDNRLWLPHWADVILSNPKAAKYVWGTAVHWYLDFLVPALSLDLTHKAYPSKAILMTEASVGMLPWQNFPHKVPRLGAWWEAEKYAQSLTEMLNHWSVGWVDWNIALNMIGGPSWMGNRLDSLLIVNGKRKEFYRQPAFYVMGHFTKFIPPGSKRIHLNVQSNRVNFCCGRKVLNVGFVRPDGGVSIILTNLSRCKRTVRFMDVKLGQFVVVMDARSIQSFVWWRS